MRDREQALHVDVEGCFNVRDAGGWPTADGRWMTTGMLYRADDPVRLSDAGRAAIAELGLQAVVDLRQQNQFDRGPGFIDRVATHHVPIVDRVIDIDAPPSLDRPADMVELYADMVERGRLEFVRAIDVLAEHIGTGPVMVHCAAGKDRTGLIVALIQAGIGVGLDEIVAEYALSDEPTRAKRAEMVANPLDGDPPVARSPVYLWTAPAEAMALFAARAVEAYGSLGAWPLGVGVAPETMKRLKDALVVARP